MAAPRPGSAFVPHDLEAPIFGVDTGPLAGLTCAVKDMYDIAGHRTGGGSPDWLAAAQTPNASAGAVRRVVDAGATVIGKTICDEFFFSVTGANAHYGTPANPRAPGRLPGGSSSGSAAATAAGACDFALGSDTGGSVRVPASFCGVFGIRPTHGRIDLSGAMAMAPSFDAAGWFSSGPGVFRKIGQVLLEGSASPMRIEQLIPLEDAFAEAEPDAAALLRSALEAMTGELPEPSPQRLAPDGLDPWRDCFRVIQGFEIWRVYGDFIERRRPRLGPGIRERLEFASKVSERDVAAARELQARARERIRRLAKPGSVLALPTAPGIAPLADTPSAALETFRVSVMRLTCIAGLSGLPQVTIPVGSLSGCPVGLSFIGWPGADEVLLDLAVTVSRHCGRQG